MENEPAEHGKGQITIRLASESDFEEIWPILREVIERGDTFAYDPTTTKDGGRGIWMETPLATYVRSSTASSWAVTSCGAISPVVDRT